MAEPKHADKPKNKASARLQKTLNSFLLEHAIMQKKIMTEDRLCKNKAYFFVLKVLVLASIIGLAIIRN